MFKHFNKLMLIGVIALSLPWMAWADVIDNINQSLTVNSEPRLDLKNINGNVVITAWDKSVIEVNATITADSQTERDQVSVLIEQEGNKVSVKSKYDQQHSRDGNNAKVDYNIRVPSLSALSSIELVNGSLVITGVEGEIVAELVNGSFEATGAAGNANITSVNGGINLLYQNNINNLNSIDLATVNGAIKLYLPEAIGAEMKIETMHGSIKNDFGLSVDKHKFFGRELHGIIGDGKVEIAIETVNGAIKVLQN